MEKILYIYVPDMKHIVRIKEGSTYDMTNGIDFDAHADFIVYNVYELGDSLIELDGGVIMLEKSFRKFEDAIPYVLEMAYHFSDIEHEILASF